MTMVRVSADGQITVPAEIRRSLRLKEGDKVVFSQNDRGEIVLSNSSLIAIKEAQEAVFDSVYSDEDILADVLKLRYKGKSS